MRKSMRISYKQNEFGESISYLFLEKSEAHRVALILKAIGQANDWMSLSELTKVIKSKPFATSRTLDRIRGAKTIDVMMSNGNITVIAKDPLLLKKDDYNRQSDPGKRYLRCGVFIKLNDKGWIME
jgi:hypothetical protein